MQPGCGPKNTCRPTWRAPRGSTGGAPLTIRFPSRTKPLHTREVSGVTWHKSKKCWRFRKARNEHLKNFVPGEWDGVEAARQAAEEFVRDYVAPAAVNGKRGVHPREAAGREDDRTRETDGGQDGVLTTTSILLKSASVHPHVDLRDDALHVQQEIAWRVDGARGDTAAAHPSPTVRHWSDDGLVVEMRPWLRYRSGMPMGRARPCGVMPI